ncbi:Inositol 2-dehydrogenase [Paenibacillus konkukensis]|uniref:Inositol 2-dehydrogenase n=1 Tax=Paenibacillus konkukensis TaxID=2020716 RepID=A0ABY4RL68_9BACL|nr:Gfo/Idh/MocA family oxidoreductase [Paenibacillus konkukensis]UQZ82318.1 Inositol 2-dehydrogenase [Paenibacillus konkukensis]
MTSHERMRVAIIGQGRSGKAIHGDTLNRLKDKFEIAAVVDPLEERRQKAAETYGCEVLGDYKELLGRTDIDLVVNATPSHMHVPVTLELLNHGQHVLCDKPLARYAAEVDQLIQASGRTGSRLFVFQQSRFLPGYRKIRAIVDSGVIGRVVQVHIAYNGFARRWDWQTLREYNAGNLLNTGPHPVDQALQFIGTQQMPQVTCYMDRANTLGDAEDYVKLLMSAPGKPVVDVEISSCCAYPGLTYNIQGTLGGIRGSGTHLDWKYYKPEEAPPQQLTHAPYVNEQGEPAYCREELKWHEHSWDFADEHQLGSFDHMCREYYIHLHDHLTQGVPLEITLEEVRQQIAVMEECHKQNPLPSVAAE